MSFLKRPSPREQRKQKARDFILRADRPVTTAEVAEHICVTMASTTQLLVEMVQEKRIKVTGRAPNSRWEPYESPEPAMPASWRAYQPPKPTVIPVRRFGRIAPDIYEQTITLGGNEE